MPDLTTTRTEHNVLTRRPGLRALVLSVSAVLVIGTAVAVAVTVSDHLRTAARRFAHHELPPEHADQGRAFEQQQIGRNLPQVKADRSEQQGEWNCERNNKRAPRVAKEKE